MRKQCPKIQVSKHSNSEDDPKHTKLSPSITIVRFQLQNMLKVLCRLRKFFPVSKNVADARHRSSGIRIRLQRMVVCGYSFVETTHELRQSPCARLSAGDNNNMIARVMHTNLDPHSLGQSHKILTSLTERTRWGRGTRGARRSRGTWRTMMHLHLHGGRRVMVCHAVDEFFFSTA